jgi:hypothetical protein
MRRIGGSRRTQDETVGLQSHVSIFLYFELSLVQTPPRIGHVYLPMEPAAFSEKVLPQSSKKEGIDGLMKQAMKVRTSKEANALIDKLGKFGEDAVYALEEVVDRTKFEDVRTHALQTIRDIKSEDNNV